MPAAGRRDRRPAAARGPRTGAGDPGGRLPGPAPSVGGVVDERVRPRRRAPDQLVAGEMGGADHHGTDPGNPLHPGDRRGHGLFPAVHRTLPRGATAPRIEDGGHPGRAARCPGANPRLRRHRDRRAVVPAVQRSGFQSFPGAGDRHRRGLRGARFPDPAPEPHLPAGPGLLLAPGAAFRSRPHG